LLGIENLNEGLDSFFEKGGSAEDHIESFLGDRNERKAKEFRNGDGGDTHIHLFGKNG
jgi:hypothetical protein